MFTLKKYENTKNSKIFFWGCTHVFHNPDWPVPIWKLRGYDSVENHAKGIKDKINSVCSKNDILFLIGDGFLNSGVEQVENYLKELNPQIKYYWGNHESSTIQIYRREVKKLSYNFTSDDIEIYPLKYNNIEFMGNYGEIQIKLETGRKVNMVISHFPFRVFNNSKRDWVSAHSHNHGGLPSSLPNAQEGKILETSVDVFPNGPVSIEEVMKIMDKKENKKFDKHH